MLQQNKTKLLRFFFEEPTRRFHIRELARMSGIAHTSVKNYLQELVIEKLIIKVKSPLYAAFIANEENRMYRLRKQQDMVFQIYSSGLVDFLEDSLQPRCIILFGSVRKGEYNKTSDIDIFIQTQERKIDLSKFEKKLQHSISLFFEEDIHKLSNELFNNIVNGFKISGYLKL